MTRRALLIGTAAGVGIVAGRSSISTSAPGPSFPAAPISETSSGAGATVLNDASELSPTRVVSHLVIRSEPKDVVVDRLRAAMAEARAAGRPFVASAARHSMGGRSMAAFGTVATLDQEWLEPDTTGKVYRVAAGARWATIIKRLDAIGFSPAVMQSNNDFGVASTFSVNAHGWPVPFSGCGSTVRRLSLVLPDGAIVSCSRTENRELFRHAMGGYGLFGVITELDLDMVPNARLTPTVDTMAGAEIGPRFARAIETDPSVRMAYGRMDVSLDRFLDEGLLITYRPSAQQDRLPQATGSGLVSRAAARLFRWQVESDRGKHFRWWTEARVGPRLAGEATRNTLMNEPVITLDDRDVLRTDILHEYFVPPARFADFVVTCQQVIPGSYQQLLNVTLRYVDTDSDSVLAYAPEPRIAAVMLFSQEKTARGEADMARMTRDLIDRVLELGGAYYLPYRPHATLDQLTRGYAHAAEFAAKKREIDAGLLFRHALWDGYFARL